MIWATRLISLLALAASLPLSEAVDPVEFDVWVPKILDPTAGTIWHTGHQYTVTWDNSNPPESITNPTGQIYLVSNGLILFNYELASGFDLRGGQVQVQAPAVATGSYQVVLFGDSGNDSQFFTIQAY